MNPQNISKEITELRSALYLQWKSSGKPFGFGLIPDIWEVDTEWMNS